MIGKRKGDEEEEYGIVPDRESGPSAERLLEEEMAEGSF